MTELTKQDEIICHCSCTSKREIMRLINSGYDTLEKISMMTGAIAGCGACETWIEELLVEIQQSGADQSRITL